MRLHAGHGLIGLGLLLLMNEHVVSDDAIPYPATVTYGGRFPVGVVFDLPFPVPLGGHATPENACRAVVAGFPSIMPAGPTRLSGTYHHITYSPNYAGGGCYWTDSNGTVHSYDLSTSRTLGWVRNVACPNGGLSSDWVGDQVQPMCVCPPGQKFIHGNWPGGPYCALASTPTCPIGPIPPYSPDPYPALIEELSPRMQAALSCLRAAIGGQGGSSNFKSGYRPAAYNAHIQAVFDQKIKLDNYNGPADCSVRKAELAVELSRHDLGKVRPGDNSLHITREAFDLGSTLNRQVTNSLAINCNVFAPIPITDRNHFEHTR